MGMGSVHLFTSRQAVILIYNTCKIRFMVGSVSLFISIIIPGGITREQVWLPGLPPAAAAAYRTLGWGGARHRQQPGWAQSVL